jgi:hypothetical protein
VRHGRYLLSQLLHCPNKSKISGQKQTVQVCPFSLYNFCPKHTPDRWILSPLQLRRVQQYVKSVPFGTVAQIPDATSPERLKFVRWCLIFVGHKYVSLLAPTILRCKPAMLSGLKQKWNMSYKLSDIELKKNPLPCSPTGRTHRPQLNLLALVYALVWSRKSCYVRYVRLSASISATPIGRISVKYDTEYF